MKPSLFLIGALALAACLSAQAAKPSKADKPVDTPQRMLARMDRNVDGKISFEEFRNAVTRRFDARDKNKDGVLSADEVPKEWLIVSATDQADGQVTHEEFAAALQPTFDRFDADHDGQLDTTEIAAFAAARAAKENAP